MVTVGIDPHKHVHVAVAVDAGGKRIGRPLTVRNDALLVATLLKWIRSIANGSPVTWAIEDGRGFARRLADGLLLAGHEVVWVPSRLTAAHRKLHAATGAKSDSIDAAAAAHAAIATPDLDRHRIDEHVRELRVLVDYRADLIKRRTMVINQLKAQLHVWLDHTPRRPRPRQEPDLADRSAARGTAGQAHPSGVHRDDHRDSRPQPTRRRTRKHDPGPRQPAGTHTPEDHRDQSHLRSGPHRGDRRHHPLLQLG